MDDRDAAEEEIVYRARPNLSMGRMVMPLFALLGGVATGISFLVLVVQNPTTRWAGLGWMAFGLAGYVVYRRRFVRAPLTEVVKAPPAFGPALALEYRRILVPVVGGRPSDEALDVACRLAARRSRVVALSVLEVPLDRPLGDEYPELEREANRELDEAVRIGDSYGVEVPQPLRARAFRGAGDRRRGGGAPVGDHRARLPASAAHCAAGRRVREDRGLHPQARPLPRAHRRLGVVMRAYRIAVVAFSVTFVLLGMALLARTAVGRRRRRRLPRSAASSSRSAPGA